MKRIIFVLLLLGQCIYGQIKPGRYLVIKDSLTKGIELVIRDDKTFTYSNRNHTSCFVWYKINGTWEIEFDKLILKDYVSAFKGKLENFTTLHRTTVYRISEDKLIFNSQYHDKIEPEYIYSRNLFGNFLFEK